MSQKLVDGKVNRIVMSAVGGVVENSVERVYDFIVAEDVVLKLIKGRPALEGYDIVTGPWDHAGAARWLNMEGGFRARESINSLVRPYLFEYQLEDFSSPDLREITDLAAAHWTFMPVGPRTHIKWYYAWRVRKPEHMEALYEFVANTWRGWMTTAFAETKRLLDRDVFSA
jgi:hypothetical protein